MGSDALSLIKNKKALIGLLIFGFGAFLFLFSPTPVDATHNTSRALACSRFGDVDNDGDIDLADADYINDNNLIGQSVSSGWRQLAADVNDDKANINLSDVLLIQAYANFEVNTFPVCSTSSRSERPCSPTGNIDSLPGVSSFDALLVMRYVAALDVLSASQLENADVDNHGSPVHPVASSNIEGVDAILMMLYADNLGDDFGPCPTISVESSPITSVSMSGSQGGTSGTTNYIINPSSDIDSNITAPATKGSYDFSSWTGNCTFVTGTTCRVTLTNDTSFSSRTITANYVLNPGVIDLDPPTTGCPGTVVNLIWASNTTDSTYNIIMDGSAVSSSSGLSWTSGTLTAGVSHTWQIQDTSSGGVRSNIRTYTTETCTVPPTAPP